MNKLQPSDFGAFFAEVHGGNRQPFTWQQELLDRLLAEGSWPGQIDVPTGLGKTTVIDIFVFVNALQPGTFGRRLFFVIDRRVVVDQAYAHAEGLAQRLSEAADGSVAAVVRHRIEPRAFDASGRALWVERMRGGATWPWQWVDRADRIAVIVGTAAQVGSRLLFRGHGVPEHRRSIDAALVGTDSVIVVDEAHIAIPMLRSSTDALELDQSSLLAPTQIVSMSATIPARERAGDAERRWVQRVDPSTETSEAVKRLNATKHLSTVAVTPTSKARADAMIAKTLAEQAEELADGERRVIGVFCNTVKRARLAFRALSPGKHEGRVALLTGRMREYDRERFDREWLRHFAAGMQPSDDDPRFLVATQAVEVGADIDLDGLATESASLDAIVQRLGRLNRRGRSIDARAVVVHDTSTPDDAIYGPSHLRTWEWLSQLHARADGPGDRGTDVSPLALRARLAEMDDDTRRLLSPTPVTVPIMSAERLAVWARTSPTPAPDIPVTPFIYGLRRDEPTVTVVWRDGLPREAFSGDGDGGAVEQMSKELDQCPPRPFEGIDLPIGALRRWLGGIHDADLFTDAGLVSIDGDDADEDDAIPLVARRSSSTKPRGRNKGNGSGSENVTPWTVVPVRDVDPDDLVVVPVWRGGLDKFGWDPSAIDAVDVGDLGPWRGRWAIRIGPSLRRHLEDASSRGQTDDALIESFDELCRCLADEDRTGEIEVLVRSWAAEASSTVPADEPVAAPLRVLAGTGTRGALADAPRDPNGYPIGTVAVVTLSDNHESANLAFAEDESALGSSAIGIGIDLELHQGDVAARARAMASAIQLPMIVAASIELAARFHDEGKRDPRFQAMLHGGDAFLADAADKPLAKSGMDPADRAALREAARRSSYPRGMRHEALSSQVVRRYAELNTDVATVDLDLVIHLVASHHGRNRPLLPPIVDDDPRIVEIEGVGSFDTSQTVDWDAPSRFVALNERYGCWGLAMCETVLRLADQSASATPRLDLDEGDIAEVPA